MPISQNLNYSFLSYPEKRQEDNAIITFEETKVFEIENASFLSILKLYKTRDWDRVLDANLCIKKQLRNTSCSSSFSIYLSFGRTRTDSNCSKSLQKAKHNIVNTCNYHIPIVMPCENFICIRFHQLFEMSGCIY